MAAFRLAVLFAVLFASPLQAAGLPAEVTINGVEFVRIPAGNFWYTVEIDVRKEKPKDAPVYKHVRIWLDGYYMAKYETRARDLVRFLNSGVVRAETLERMKWGGSGGGDQLCSIKRERSGRYVEAHPAQNMPAADLSWTLAVELAQWMGFRLPTEAEWQKAARGTERRIWPWGDFVADDTYALFGWTQDCRPAPVDAFPKGRSPYGLYNMAGNVTEFVADWYNADFDAALRDGMRNPPLAAVATALAHDEPRRLTKGGRWTRDLVGHSIAERGRMLPYATSNRNGVRFAIDEAQVRAMLASGRAQALPRPEQDLKP